MSGIDDMISAVTSPQELWVSRSDPVYMAHAYLTKVPVAAIEPFIKAFTKPGDVVVDPFAGSGMTGVAAAALGRSARLFDISALGRHIGTNYVNLVDGSAFQVAAKAVAAAVRARVGDPYGVSCQRCGRDATLAKRIWSIIVECPKCETPINYYRAFEAAHWHKSKMCCPGCGSGISSKSRRLGEDAVIDSINCVCSAVQLDQEPSNRDVDLPIEGLRWPEVEIGAERQMYQASALGRHGLTTIAAFYSDRNLAVLAALRDAINAVSEVSIRNKLLFAFTAILTRASKRYQWSLKRPLNAANANYYIAPVFYEWNVFELFERKVDAALRSDDWIRDRRGAWRGSLFNGDQPDVAYELASAESLPLADESVDYVFTDPPFGSNLFYADMALFQEAWLGEFTDASKEAVIDRGRRKQRTADRYEDLLAAALSECRRILRPGGWITMVFGNSSGSIWALLQRAVTKAGLLIEADSVAILNKGQRSVKGLASGFEHVATLDLILSMRSAKSGEHYQVHRPSSEEIVIETRRLLGDSRADSPSHLYVELLRHGIRVGWDLSEIDLRTITDVVRETGWQVNPASGKLDKLPTALIASEA
jgi:DNA modification methylase